MQEAFGTMIWVVVAAGGLVGLICFAGTAGLYKQIGRGAMSINEDQDWRPRAAGTGAQTASGPERDEEIRQMLGAANERRARRGQAPLDIDAELARLTAPAADPGLEAEVRSLVVARNERRARAGREPLDVEAEVRRQLSALTTET